MSPSRVRVLVVAGAVVALVGGLVLVLDGGDGPETVRSAAPTTTATTATTVETTTPPAVLGESVERVPDGRSRPDVEESPTEDVSTGAGTPDDPGPSSTVTEPVAAPPPAEPAPPPPPPDTAPAPEPAAETASVEVHRGPDSPVMHVELQRDGETVAAGTLHDTLRFDDLAPGPYRLQVSWHHESVEDEETGETIAGGGMARYDIDAASGTTVVVCDPDACTVTERR